MRQLLGFFLLFWAGLSGYFAYGSAAIAGHYRILGWSYVELPLRSAFGEENKSPEEVDKIWRLALSNARSSDPSIADDRYGLMRFVADGFADSASRNFSRFGWFLAFNCLISVTAGIALIRSSVTIPAPKSPSK